jgi:hypothetical protein
MVLSQSAPRTIAPIRVIQVRLLRAFLWDLIYPCYSHQDINLTCHPHGFKLGSNFFGNSSFDRRRCSASSYRMLTQACVYVRTAALASWVGPYLWHTSLQLESINRC